MPGTPRILSSDTADRIQSAKTFADLRRLHGEWLHAGLPHTGDSAEDAAPLADQVQQAHDLFLSQGMRISLRTLKALGMGDPPVPYAWFLFGSGARREQGWVSDQDSGLVYRCPPAAGERERHELDLYFRVLTSTMVQGLAETGYPLCEGGVICSHPAWRGSAEDWEHRFDVWGADPHWSHVRYLLLAADVRHLAGDPGLTAELMASYRTQLARRPWLIPRMMSNTLRHRVPLGWFGRLLVEMHGPYQGGLNIKTGLYLPIVNCVRLWSLAYATGGTGTLERIAALHETGAWPSALADEVQAVFRRVMGLRLLSIRHWPTAEYQRLSYVLPERLSQETAHHLKPWMRTVLNLQRLTARRFGTSEPRQARGPVVPDGKRGS